MGDWYPDVSPARKSTGQVQIYDLASESWMNNTTSMPPSMEVGNFGMTSIGTKIYIAGGVQNSSGNDATDRLLEYNTVTGIWTELANMSEKRFAFPLVASALGGSLTRVASGDELLCRRAGAGRFAVKEGQAAYCRLSTLRLADVQA